MLKVLKFATGSKRQQMWFMADNWPSSVKFRASENRHERTIKYTSERTKYLSHTVNIKLKNVSIYCITLNYILWPEIEVTIIKTQWLWYKWKWNVIYLIYLFKSVKANKVKMQTAMHSPKMTMNLQHISSKEMCRKSLGFFSTYKYPNRVKRQQNCPYCITIIFFLHLCPKRYFSPYSLKIFLHFTPFFFFYLQGDQLNMAVFNWSPYHYISPWGGGVKWKIYIASLCTVMLLIKRE